MPGAPVSPRPAVFALFSLDNIAEVPAATFTGWLNSHCKNNHIGPRSRRLFYLAMIPIVPQRTHGTTARDDPEPHAKTGQSRDGTDIYGRYSMAWRCNGTGSLPTSASYLAKKRCADNGLPRRGSHSFYLAFRPQQLSPAAQGCSPSSSSPWHQRSRPQSHTMPSQSAPHLGGF